MASRFEKETPELFKKEMVKFYQCCNVEETLIEDIMRENDSKINKYLVATPELIARKLYEEKVGEKL